MISRLNDNPVGKALAWICAGLLGVLLLLGVAWLMPPSGAGAGAGAAGDELSGDIPQLEPGKPIETYAVITDRPVFNESRQPVIGAEEGDEDEGFDQAEDPDAPDVQLAGVVITPELRVATLRLKDSPESLLAFEGQPLEGSFGSWRLSRIEPRVAILESGTGEQVRLELQVHDAMIDAPPEPAAKPEPGSQANQDAGADEPPMTRAEEIRQRIAQRREELRRAAEEGGEPPQTPRVDYREAIQAMMAGQKDQDQEKDENEQ